MKKHILATVTLIITVFTGLIGIIYYFKINAKKHSNTHVLKSGELDKDIENTDSSLQNAEYETSLNENDNYNYDYDYDLERQIEDLKNDIYGSDISKMNEL